MTTDRVGRFRNALTRSVLALVAVGGVALSSANLPVRAASADDELVVPDPQVAKLLAFGFDAVMSDFYWMRAVQIVGSTQGPYGRSHTLAALIDVVTTLDPHVDHPYRFAAVWINDDEASVRKSNELIRRGIAHHPDDWRGYFYLAFNHFYYLGESEEAARALEPALSLPGRPQYLSRLAARLKSKSGGLEASAAFLSELARQAQSDEEREQYLVALREIETERRARFLDTARAAYVRRHRRDIAAVEDLVSGRVLRALPPDPFGEGWELSAETGQIVSKHIRYRYGVKIDPTSQMEIDRFRERSRRPRGQ
jgi:tetratricopeptide (TPR) repeat protein